MSFSMKLPGKKGKETKQYGLILPKKDASNKKERSGAFNVFAQAAERGKINRGEEDTTTTTDAAALRRKVGEEAARSFQQMQVERTHKQALAEDPSVFDYDGVYDDMTNSRREKASQRKALREAEKKQPKYITTLIEKAKIREIENERIRERRLLNERKAEDALYGDKEKLVSASYKRKLMEMKKWDEEDARLDAIEAHEDVTKQGEHAMAGFYANLLTKNIAMGGSTSHSRSAYTAGGATKQPLQRSETEVKNDNEQSEQYNRLPVTITQENEENPQAVKKRRVDEEEFDGDGQGGKALTTQPEQPVTAKHPPKPSKEDVISAAQARFLARKAQRSAAAADSTRQNVNTTVHKS